MMRFLLPQRGSKVVDRKKILEIKIVDMDMLCGQISASYSQPVRRNRRLLFVAFLYKTRRCREQIDLAL